MWQRGGYPDSYLSASDRVSDIWRRDFIRTYLESDIPNLGPRIPAERLRRFWTMLAHLHGGLLKAADLARALEVDNKTITSYLDLLVDLLLVRRLSPWHANVGKRLVKSPKIYVRDSGLVHSLLQIPDKEGLLANPKLGDSWEGFVIENICSVLPPLARPYFYRTAAGAEIDLIVDLGSQIWAIEIKRSSVCKLTKGFFLACEDLKPARKIVVHGGDDGFMMPNQAEALPVSRVMVELRKLSTPPDTI